jgi:hypothetical protein
MKTWWKKSAHWMSQRDHVDPCDLLADLPSGVRASQSGLQEGKYFLHAWFLSMASTDVASDDQSLLCSGARRLLACHRRFVAVVTVGS